MITEIESNEIKDRENATIREVEVARIKSLREEKTKWHQSLHFLG